MTAGVCIRPWLLSFVGQIAKPHSLISNTRTLLSEFCFYTSPLGAQTVVNGRHKPGDKLNDSWNPSPWGTCWLFIVAHKHKAGREFISFRFRWLKWVFEYLKKVVNVYRHLHKSFFHFILLLHTVDMLSLAIILLQLPIFFECCTKCMSWVLHFLTEYHCISMKLSFHFKGWKLYR